MNPFRRFPRFRFPAAFARWPLWHVSEIPIERPPRSRPARGRVHVVWRGEVDPPYLVEIEEPTRLESDRLQPWL